MIVAVASTGGTIAVTVVAFLLITLVLVDRKSTRRVIIGCKAKIISIRTCKNYH